MSPTATVHSSAVSKIELGESVDCGLCALRLWKGQWVSECINKERCPIQRFQWECGVRAVFATGGKIKTMLQMLFGRRA